MKRTRLLLAVVTALAAVGCNLVLGIDSDYTVDEDASVGEGGTDSGAGNRDATVTDGGDSGPAQDANGDSGDAQLILDAGPVLCPDGASSPTIAMLGTTCCANSALACDQGQELLPLACDNGIWIPAGTCQGKTLCRFDLGAYPDGGAENGGTILGGGTANGNLGTCAPEISACSGHAAGDIVCATDAGNVLVQCGADLTTAYAEACISANLCNAHIGSHCRQCFDGEDFECNANAPAYCSDGGYVQQPVCDAGYNCHPNDGTCGAQFCAPSTYTCVGDDLQLCDPTNGNFYADAGLCEAGTCDKKGLCDLCVKSTNYGCNAQNTSYSACNAAGTMVNVTNCTGATPFCSQSGGNPTCVACLHDSDCTATPPNICQTAACTSGACGFQPAPGSDGTVVTGPAPGACTETTCQGGAVTPTNLPDNTVVVQPNGMTCTEMVCTKGVAGPANAPAGTTCVEADGVTMSTCDANGNCM